MYALAKRPVTVLTLLVTDFNIKTQREKKSAFFCRRICLCWSDLPFSCGALPKIAVNVSTFSSREDKAVLFSCNCYPTWYPVVSPDSDRRLPDGSSPCFLSFFLFLLLIVSLLIQDADGKNDVSKKSRINLVKYPDNLNQKGESHD